MSIKVLRPEKDYVLLPYAKGGVAKAIIWPGMGAKYGSMNYFVMEPGGENVPHTHKDAEDMFYIASGSGVIRDYNNNIDHPFEEGCFVYVPPNIKHAAINQSNEDYISIGGPSPLDLEMYKKAGLKW